MNQTTASIGPDLATAITNPVARRGDSSDSWFVLRIHADSIYPSVENVNRIIHNRRSIAAQSLAEYSLILALIAVIAIVALLFLGSQIVGILSSLGENI